MDQNFSGNFYFFGVFRPTREFFNDMGTSQLSMKASIWPMLGTLCYWAVMVLYHAQARIQAGALPARAPPLKKKRKKRKRERERMSYNVLQPFLRFHYLLKYLILMSFKGASPPRAPHRALPWTRWGPWRSPDPSPIQGAPTNVYSWIRAWCHTYFDKGHLYNGHLRDPLTSTPITERFAEELSLPVYLLRSVVDVAGRMF